MADTILELLEGAAKEPYIRVLEDLIKVALPAALSMLAGSETPAEIALPVVKDVLALGVKQLEDLAAHVPEAQARNDFDNGLGNLLESIKFGDPT